jgi:hypothetical protein
MRELALQALRDVPHLAGPEEPPVSPRLASHGAVVCDWRITTLPCHQLLPLLAREYRSVAMQPPTPPPKSA